MAVTTTRLFLTRHAEVEARYQKVFAGRLDVALSPRGQAQAVALADWLRRRPLDAIYASPMRRVQQTLTPLTERLDKLVTISKEALWETRHYMFTLKPLISGMTTLTQMLTNQLHEFEAISGLPAHLEVEGIEVSPNGDQRRTRKTAQVGTAIFRITQEALTNAYKHADATQVKVYLHHLPQCIEVEISDDGKGLHTASYGYTLGANGGQERIYSGYGMRGMRERAEELGGTFEIKQGHEGGTSVLARIPFKEVI